LTKGSGISRKSIGLSSTRLLASEFGETGGGELDGLPALQDRFDQPRAHKGEKIVVMAPTARLLV
jgi:hypothetical protein